MPFDMDHFERSYDTEIFPVKIGSHRLRFYKPASIDRFINTDDPLNGFPLWAKIWEASAVMAQYLADLPVVPGERILELGAGLGVAGIVAAVLGHDVTLTEYDANALNFLRANVVLNHCGSARVAPLDWFAPDLEGHFDMIIGSEIVYQQNAVEALGRIFQQYLSPEGKVVLAERVRPTGAVFFEKMAGTYDIRTQKRTLRFKDKTETVVLFELSKRS